MKNFSKKASDTFIKSESLGDSYMLKSLKFMRYVIAGSLFGIYSVGFAAQFLGYDTSIATDYVAALGGGSVVAALAKTQIISI